MAVSADTLALSATYKLVEYAGRPVIKLSTGKSILRASKQVWRRVRDGVFEGSVIGLEGDTM